VVTTFTDTVAGEIVTLIFVTGSVQVEVEVVADVLEVLVVQVTAVLAGAWWMRPGPAGPRAKQRIGGDSPRLSIRHSGFPAHTVPLQH